MRVAFLAVARLAGPACLACTSEPRCSSNLLDGLACASRPMGLLYHIAEGKQGILNIAGMMKGMFSQVGNGSGGAPFLSPRDRHMCISICRFAYISIDGCTNTRARAHTDTQIAEIINTLRMYLCLHVHMYLYTGEPPSREANRRRIVQGGIRPVPGFAIRR